MADDISELLDEVERKFCSPKATTVSKPTVNPHGNSKSTHPTSAVPVLSEDDDLDQIISEIVNDIDADFAPHVSAYYLIDQPLLCVLSNE